MYMSYVTVYMLDICILVILAYTLGLGHTGSQVLSPKSVEVNLCNLNHWEHGSWDLPLYTGPVVLSPKYDMDAYMATFFGGEAWDMCCELDQVKC